MSEGKDGEEEVGGLFVLLSGMACRSSKCFEGCTYMYLQ